MAVTLTSYIPQYITQLNDRIKTELERQARIILLDAQTTVPVITGNLRDSGKITEVLMSGGIIEYGIAFTAPYAAKVEAKHHFLYTAYVNNEQNIIDGIARAIKAI